MVEGGLGWCSVSAQDGTQKDAGLLVLGSFRKQTEQAMESKPVCSNSPSTNSCLQIPALVKFLF